MSASTLVRASRRSASVASGRASLQVIGQRAGEDVDVLGDHADLAGDGDRAGQRAVDAGDQTGQGRLARAARADQGDPLAGLDRQVDVVQDRAAGVVGVAEVAAPRRSSGTGRSRAEVPAGRSRRPAGPARRPPTGRRRSAPARCSPGRTGVEVEGGGGGRADRGRAGPHHEEPGDQHGGQARVLGDVEAAVEAQHQVDALQRQVDRRGGAPRDLAVWSASSRNARDGRRAADRVRGAAAAARPRPPAARRRGDRRCGRTSARCALDRHRDRARPAGTASRGSASAPSVSTIARPERAISGSATRTASAISETSPVTRAVRSPDPARSTCSSGSRIARSTNRSRSRASRVSPSRDTSASPTVIAPPWVIATATSPSTGIVIADAACPVATRSTMWPSSGCGEQPDRGGHDHHGEPADGQRAIGAHQVGQHRAGAGRRGDGEEFAAHASTAVR